MGAAENLIEAKKGMLKQLANKMYEIEVEAWKKGDAPKPKAVPKEMKQTKEETKKIYEWLSE